MSEIKSKFLNNLFNNNNKNKLLYDSNNDTINTSIRSKKNKRPIFNFGKTIPNKNIYMDSFLGDKPVSRNMPILLSPRRSRNPRRSMSSRRTRSSRPTSPNIQNMIRSLSPSRSMSPRRSRRSASPRRAMSPRRSRAISPRRSRAMSPRRSRAMIPRPTSPNIQNIRSLSPRRSMSSRRSISNRPSSPTLRELLSRSNNNDPLPNYNNLFPPSYKQALDM
jgi:hypothetical protein